ncbi:Flagellar hook capping protein [Neorhizobium galegae bv. officinalis bv. officinalis str. HAMBI 1141]|uniref:Basal-body rod modification protein FlgD n=1 Tax=Neorhizobium galegae bv. officinalis bv. officinalis str. HAMBI 1141 TaxID=1028801 RepID=A0A068T3H3_NEOGA|nr:MULTISPECIES: flagellar hook assembly protein FlgD [Neorhizobium]MCJ9670180.1 flagellar hook assembly protein FlgD [Neorhizobium sp. SHOUNA12B]MCJ9744683.1 flagellar hook assembly protein FlgD [Neorhizobium sp. SHOUNA12A]MCJ9750484.1 flagellar hook assembly protein FlgD [Neorhizobium sp. BETTINA12A]CDN52634.1 Flagellar hook capping protein [Neorhizobium galegae bv. officinalis bv. officinalis str. HAMBI 1141]
MAVDSINTKNPYAAGDGKAASSDKSAAGLNYDNFLKLLIAQMKYQDPTDPMDASQQISQLATFSQVEQSVKMNSNLQSLIQASSFSQAADMIGKTITSADDKTTGVIKQVEIYSDGLVAITEKGDKVLIQPGIVLSNQPAASS